MAKKTMRICDSCGTEVEDGKGGILRLNFSDSRKGSRLADICDSCAQGIPGVPVAKRGRPKST